MTRTSAQETLPGRLAEHLTELVSRLRLSSSPCGDRLLPPRELPRLVAAVRLLRHAARAAGEPGLPLLADSVEELAAWATARPQWVDEALDGPISLLTAFAERLLEDLDSGRPVAQAARDGRWEEALQAFRAVEQAPPVRLEDALCVLLLAESLQRDMLEQKLREAGCRTVATDDPGRATDLATAGESPVVVLAENLEPERRLEDVLRRFESRPRDRSVRCVLVGGASGGAARAAGRARTLGADGAWPAPHDPAELQRVLDAGPAGANPALR